MQNVWKILKRFLTNLVLILFPFFLYSLTYFLYFCSPKFTFRMIIYNLAKLYESYMMIFFQKLKATADNRLKTQHHTLWFSEVVNDHATYKCQTFRHNCYFHPALNSANNLAINEKNRGENMSHFRINSLDSSYMTHWTRNSKKSVIDKKNHLWGKQVCSSLTKISLFSDFIPLWMGPAATWWLFLCIDEQQVFCFFCGFLLCPSPPHYWLLLSAICYIYTVSGFLIGKRQL